MNCYTYLSSNTSVNIKVLRRVRLFHYLEAVNIIFVHVSSSDTAATLKQTKELPIGEYKVPVDVNDLQGSGKTQMVTVRICQCWNGECPAKQSSVSLGALALLAMLLPLALLLLLCESHLLYSCQQNCV